MPVNLPPPKAKTAKGERGIFDAFINAHPALKNYAGAIWTNANNYGGITPTQLAAVLWAESKGQNGAVSGAGAKGIGQIWDKSADAVNAAGVPFFRPGNLTISDADKSNPAFAIQYAAWRLSGYATTHGGSIDQIWIGGYNPNYKPGVDGPANFISQYLPKGYVGTPSSTIDQAATKSVQTSTVTSSLKDPWVVQTKGGFKFVNSAQPPAGTVQYGGQPITRSQYNQVWNQTYSDTFFAYTGRHANASEVTDILSRAPSVYSLANDLAGKPGFDKSPVWKQHAPGLVSYARTVLGDSWKPSGGIIRQAIAQNWDQATFYAHLKQTPAYVKGPEFQDNRAKMQTVYEQIYGKADAGAHTLINETTLQGWTPDELASWLRSQDAYKQTPEYQSKQVSFLSALGLITGQQATLSQAQVDSLGQDPTAPSFGAAPTGADTSNPNPALDKAEARRRKLNVGQAVRPQTKTPVGR